MNGENVDNCISLLDDLRRYQIVQSGNTVTGTPEQRARRGIDANLAAAGWLVQSREELDLEAGRGIAVREFPMRLNSHYVWALGHQLTAITQKPLLRC